MKTKPEQDHAVPAPALDLEDAADTAMLEAGTGLLTGWKARGAIREANGEGWARVGKAKANARANIALTSLHTAEAKIRSAIVGAAMPQIGALSARLNAATAAVDQALSSGAAAEAYTHLSSRAANVAFASELAGAGKITAEERDLLCQFALEDANQDILRTRERMNKAKAAVDALHACALEGIERAKSKLRSE
jgi:hypothetical protein